MKDFSDQIISISHNCFTLQNLERARGSLRRDEVHEFRVGRIKHERVKVPRGDQLLQWAMQVMKVHADRKAILEVEFTGEEGTGTNVNSCRFSRLFFLGSFNSILIFLADLYRFRSILLILIDCFDFNRFHQI